MPQSPEISSGRIGALVIASCLMAGLPAANAAEQPLKVFILAGQSNMEGKAKISLLETQLEDPTTGEQFAHLRQEDGTWVVRDDVVIKFWGRHGGLTVGYGSPNCIGPELEFGNTVGDHFDQPVLLIKTAWGGRSLYRDFRSPSAGLPKDEQLQQDLANLQKKNPDATLEDAKALYGTSYREMVQEVHQTLEGLGELFPQFEGKRYELAGFIWFQGWNDKINKTYTAAYTENLVHFINDVRQDLHAPQLPFVIGVLGVGGVSDQGPSDFQRAQAAAADRPEFNGNVLAVNTDQYWDQEADVVYKKGWKEHSEEWNKVGSDHPYHYLGSVKCYSRIGRGLAEAAIKLQPVANP